MNRLFVVLLIFSANVFSEEICKDYPLVDKLPFVWKESDFTKVSAEESMKSIQAAMGNNGEIGACGLPNSLAIIEGYILKQQAVKALSIPDLDSGLKEYYLSGFCEYVRNSSPCE